MSKFHPLKVKQITRETPEAVSIEFEIPAELSNDFQYKQGQYLTFKFNLKGNEIRRSYSLCSAPSADKNLKVAVKEVESGLASTFLNRNLKEGDVLEAMPPMGNFYTEIKSGQTKNYVGIAAGSGITPVFSIIKETLLKETQSKFTLLYFNKNSTSVIFKNELNKWAQDFAGRLEIIFVFSRETGSDPLLNGRPDKQKLTQILESKNLLKADEYFICGPEEMIINSNDILQQKGNSKDKIHFELFTTPVKMAAHSEPKTEGGEFSGDSQVKVIIDGIETNFILNSAGESVLDAAMNAGADAPFSCKGAVCCTCKAKVIKGKAIMDMNYALTDKEVEQGFILSCQAHPQTAELIVDFDVS